MQLFKDFPEMIKTLRVQRGFGQREFAQLVGIPQPMLSAIEGRKRNPPSNRELLELMAEKLRIDPDSWDWDQFLGLALRPTQLTDQEKEILTSPVFLGLMSAAGRRDLKESEIRLITKHINESRKEINGNSHPQHG